MNFEVFVSSLNENEKQTLLELLTANKSPKNVLLPSEIELAQKDKIAAIRAVRIRLNLDLRTAKMLVDNLGITCSPQIINQY